jgi:hypothetical protein
MPFKSKLMRSLFKREDGAITVDWVVLCAAVIGMGMIVLTPIVFRTGDATKNVADLVERAPAGYGAN